MPRSNGQHVAKDQKQREALAIKAVGLLRQGASYTQIAEIMDTTRQTVATWIKSELTQYRKSSEQSLANWRGFMTGRYESKLLELSQRATKLSASTKLEEDTKASLLDSINKTEITIYKALREMHGLDIRPDAEVSQHQITHFVLKPGGALDLNPEDTIKKVNGSSTNGHHK